MVLGRAIVRDVYERDKAASTLAYITMAMAVAPALAPAIGGFLDVWFGWQASFLFVLAFGAVVWVWCLASARETNFQRQPLPGLRGMAVGYGELLRSPSSWATRSIPLSRRRCSSRSWRERPTS